MSRLTETRLQWAPSAADALAVSPGATPWLYGAWVPFITETTAGDTAIAGVRIQDASAWADIQLQVEFGICAFDAAENAEIPIGHFRLHMPNSGNGGPTKYKPKLPISGIPAGFRVSARYSERTGGAATWPLQVAYFEDLDSDQAMPYTTAILTSFPAGADSILLSPSATPWDDSDWEVFDDGSGAAVSVFGVAMQNPSSGVDAEIDIGDALDATDPLTTVRLATWDNGRTNNFNLPGLMPIALGAPLVGRLRKGDTNTGSVAVAFLGYRGALPGDAVIGPLLWITMAFRPPVVPGT